VGELRLPHERLTYLIGTFLYGDLSPLTDEHCNVTTYEDCEAFASGLDVHELNGAG